MEERFSPRVLPALPHLLETEFYKHQYRITDIHERINNIIAKIYATVIHEDATAMQ